MQYYPGARERLMHAGSLALISGDICSSGCASLLSLAGPALHIALEPVTTLQLAVHTTHLDNRGSQASRRGGFARSVDRTRQKGSDVLQDLGLGARGVTHNGHIDVPPQVDALAACRAESAMLELVCRSAGTCAQCQACFERALLAHTSHEGSCLWLF